MKRWVQTFMVLIAVGMSLAALVYATRLVYDLIGGLIP